MRRAILIRRILDEDLVGTHHIPEEYERAGIPGAERVGVLLLNAGPAPRSGNSDLSVRLGDRLAAMGLATFRFDFHGLGDSSGDTPRKANTFWRETHSGRNNGATLALLATLRNEFGLSTLFLGGLCAAVVPILHSAVDDPKGLAGIILLEPSFRVAPLEESTAPEIRASAALGGGGTRLRKALSIGAWLRYLTGESKLARMLGPMHPPILRAQRRLLGHTLFRNASAPLVSQLCVAVGHGVPVLAMVAEGPGVASDVSRIRWSLPRRFQPQFRLVRIPGTNHILTAGDAANTVLDEVPGWIKGVMAKRAAEASEGPAAS